MKIIYLSSYDWLQRDLFDLDCGKGLTMALLFALVLLRLVLEHDDFLELVLRFHFARNLCIRDVRTCFDPVFILNHHNFELDRCADFRFEFFDPHDVAFANFILFAAVLDNCVQNFLPPLSSLAVCQGGAIRTLIKPAPSGSCVILTYARGVVKHF